VIVSGGFINYVEILFDKYNRKIDMPIYSNKLGIEDGIVLPQYGEIPDCTKYYGPCGICKNKYITNFKKEGTVLYVGDGHTDRCAAESADMVFAKDNLEKFCIESGIKYVKYDTFKDVKDCLSSKEFRDGL
jgi:2-hydroxy-3-keto-5-methylthiopentenyl-1-phosphate phosphatase